MAGFDVARDYFPPSDAVSAALAVACSHTSACALCGFVEHAIRDDLRLLFTSGAEVRSVRGFGALYAPTAAEQMVDDM